MLHGLQEELPDARPSLLLAAELLEVEHGAALDKAKVQAALAQLAARQGLVDEALSRLNAAQALAPGHPALDRIRGDALASVWRWPEAASAYRQCTERAPGDLVAWELAAVALASAGEAQAALEAAARGLALQPRSPDLLRVQALALRDLHAPTAKAAFEAWALWKPPDEAPAVKGRCSAKVDGCADERNPVPVRWLEPPPREAKR